MEVPAACCPASPSGVVTRAASRHPAPDGVTFDWSRFETHGPAVTGVNALSWCCPT